ncbi:MAG TPA: bifunctional diaminohydroxyphosphoribosylaminopyrimidine deaminase/5-amino-6-(5-phosphoribosylamino)uracil reductase RibD, partial [Ruminococcaceae bacterium]|nr:bifunctional diaminohydroxyphosphoribosylaminopyrimidine deaminase/5-amino-6-(5-phosphoribosylamino)uracil reductase RibD [Oscillospiraceae bacterium]
GYHHRSGELHAERNALASCTESPEGAQMYVTLEPCCHYGRTPPCTDAIIEAKIGKVIVGSQDPNPKVAGKGVAKLRAAGIPVETGKMRTECDALNPIFFHYIQAHTPYVVMKYAMTADGKTAVSSGKSQWITGEEAREDVHKLRHRLRGIMVGIGTVLQDDPLLTCRIENGRNPTRIICDSRLRLPLDAKICQTAKEVSTIVAVGSLPVEQADKVKQLQQMGLQILQVPEKAGYIDLPALMKALGRKELDSILLEGGAELNASALEAGIVQEVYAYIAPKIFGGKRAKTPIGGAGVLTPAACYQLKGPEIAQVGNDLRLHYFIKGDR